MVVTLAAIRRDHCSRANHRFHFINEQEVHCFTFQIHSVLFLPSFAIMLITALFAVEPKGSLDNKAKEKAAERSNISGFE